MFIANLEDGKHRFISTDKGQTWIDGGSVTGIQYHHWATYKMSNGRLIGSYDYSKKGLIYSDDNGTTWTQVIPTTCGGGYEAEACVLELEKNKLIAIARYSIGGQGNNSSGDSEHAIISYSDDNGTTWTPWQISNTIDNMNAASCCGIVHDGIVEIFACSRWYHNGDYLNTDYTNTGKNGAIIHYTATIENALNDNFTKKGIIDYAKGESIDYHAPSMVKDKDNNILIMHIDGGEEVVCTQRFIRGSLESLEYRVKDNAKTKVFPYSSIKIEKLLSAQKIELITLINEAILSGNTINPSDPTNPTSYILDNIVYNFNFLDETKMDKINMTLTDSINGIIGTFKSGIGGSVVSEYPGITDNSCSGLLCISANTLDSKFVDEENLEFSYEFVIYSDESHSVTQKLMSTSNNTYFAINNNKISYYINSSEDKQSITFWPAHGSGDKIAANLGFYHFVYTFSKDGVINLYCNNELNSTNTIEDFKKWDYETFISLERSFPWQKKAIRMYSKALNETEILNNYNYEKSLIK